MTPPVRVSLPHQLGRAEARRRLDSGLSKLASALPGGATLHEQRWDGDRLTFNVSALAQTVTGTVEVLEHAVTIEVQLPGLLGQLGNALQDRLRQAGQKLLSRS